MKKNNQNILCSWSGGKDSCFALMQALQDGYTPTVLLNVLNEAGKISRSHGIPAAILQMQATAANLPIQLIASSWTDYETNFTQALSQLKTEYNLTHAVFGDIDLQPHRDWEEKVCANAGLTALLPLWQQDREQLVMQMLDAGITTMIVSCNEILGPDFLGRVIDKQCVNELRNAGVDVCGENGEFHTLVLDCPLFATPIEVTVTEKIVHEKYWFAQLQPK
ncbi:diphthine--ammonia ligase [Ferruginibacter sp. SUN106]|uniref:Dph6-related ATP pyrophosphatase n=1 Tax=Ferruginibacter sp. SUN106 TaxID=2978348 RepID=UPI003D364B7D